MITFQTPLQLEALEGTAHVRIFFYFLLSASVVCVGVGSFVFLELRAIRKESQLQGKEAGDLRVTS